jgi:hypothetical protein
MICFKLGLTYAVALAVRVIEAGVEYTMRYILVVDVPEF